MSSTKKRPKKRPGKPARQALVAIPQALVNAVDREVHRERSAGRKASRASLVHGFVSVGVVRRMEASCVDDASRRDAIAALLKEAAPLAKAASAAEASGRRSEAARLYLSAAAREIEAMAFMDPDDESSLKSAIVLAVHHMKKGTGYSRLPEVHVRLDGRSDGDRVQ